jgi:hypothetical protein
MAFQSKGSVAVKETMKDLTDSDVARNGAAKRPQKSFPVKDGMKNSQSFDAGAPGTTGPDAGSPNPLDPTKVGKKVQTTFPAKWGMKDGHGNPLDSDQGKAVLAEASLLKC